MLIVPVRLSGEKSIDLSETALTQLTLPLVKGNNSNHIFVSVSSSATVCPSLLVHARK